MTRETGDLALNALLQAAAQQHSGIDIELLRQVYAIEKLHQFDEARDAPLRGLQKMVEEFVASGVSS